MMIKLKRKCSILSGCCSIFGDCLQNLHEFYEYNNVKHICIEIMVIHSQLKTKNNNWNI